MTTDDNDIKILVDADALPREITDIIYKTADREKIKVLVVANRRMKVPYSPYIEAVQAENTFNGADDLIIALSKEGDIIITADVPLADRAISAKTHAINPRGTLYNQSNIKNHLAVRDLMEDIRAEGEIKGGPPPYNPRNRVDFANSLNKLLAPRRQKMLLKKQ